MEIFDKNLRVFSKTIIGMKNSGVFLYIKTPRGRNNSASSKSFKSCSSRALDEFRRVL